MRARFIRRPWLESTRTAETGDNGRSRNLDPMTAKDPPSGRERARVREITRVVARHGVEWLLGPRVTRLFARYGPSRRYGQNRALGRVNVHTRPQHVRLALEDLGATFVKLGQIASTRADLLTPEYQAELALLQDA